VIVGGSLTFFPSVLFLSAGGVDGVGAIGAF